MKKYYSEKMKKNKKLKTKVQNLNKISREAKGQIIMAYMKKISSQNLIDQIYYQANLYLKAGEREDGKLSDDEYRNI